MSLAAKEKAANKEDIKESAAVLPTPKCRPAVAWGGPEHTITIGTNWLTVTPIGCHTPCFRMIGEEALKLLHAAWNFWGDNGSRVFFWRGFAVSVGSSQNPLFYLAVDGVQYLFESSTLLDIDCWLSYLHGAQAPSCSNYCELAILANKRGGVTLKRTSEKGKQRTVLCLDRIGGIELKDALLLAAADGINKVRRTVTESADSPGKLVIIEPHKGVGHKIYRAQSSSRLSLWPSSVARLALDIERALGR